MRPDLHRQDLYFFTSLAFLIGGCLSAVMASSFISSSTQGWVGLVGTIIGAAISIGAVNYHENRRRDREIKAMEVSLYAEIADRAARCANDYIKPWKSWENRKLTSDVKKFRPTSPAVLPAVAGKLGLLDARTLLAVTQFYFRLSALSDAFEFAASEAKPDDSNQGELVDMIQRRLRSCFEPALRALERLDVPNSDQFDREAAMVYPWLKKEGGALRNVLRKYAG